ncbi:MAG TPA: hypothetical protein VKB96_14905 [Gammaproteobacteria bacterium]|jgi:hypothetical protein|nr:hypothetical protein [Gammaproteobacteria bacterium]
MLLALRERLAREFLKSGLVRVMFRGAANERELWEALRCWMILRWYAAGIAYHGPIRQA